MQKYYGTKLLTAVLMSRLEYCSYRGWQVPVDENSLDMGYLVEYEPDGKPNHSAHKGYISWSPKAVFEAAYQSLDSLSFGHALEALKAGKRVSRKGWNGKNMFIAMVDGREVPSTRKTESWLASELPLVNDPYIIMYTAAGTWQPGWLASQADMLARDWGVVE
jgi:hypothetical protein